MKEDIATFGKRSVQDIRDINADLIEKAMQMRCQAYLAHAKAKLLSETIYEVDKSKKEIVHNQQELAQDYKQLSSQKAELMEEIAKREMIENELLRAKSEAELANKTKSQFLATMSHEIRTPMNGIIGMIDLVEKTDLNDEQARMLGTAHQSALSLLTIIDDILDFSKIESGKMELERTPLSVRDIIENIGSNLSSSAARKQIELLIFIDPDIPDWLIGDPHRLSQIILNLGSNAIKFTETTATKTGRVVVRASLAGQADDENIYVEFAVDDNGIGISDDVFETLFQPFTQAEESTTRRFGGTGLGLSICHRLTKMMNGKIRCDSVPNKGSSFRVTIPLKTAGDFSRSTKEDRNLEGLRVLIHSTDAEHAGFMKTYLEKWNVDATTVNTIGDAETAIMDKATAGSAYDIAIFDSNSVSSTRARDSFALAERLSDTGTKFLLTRFYEIRSDLHQPKNCFTIHGTPLARSAFLNGVATTAGRTDITDISSQKDTPDKEALIVPSSDEAEEAGNLVLFAEDNPVNQEVTLKQLNKLGYAVEVANNGKEALALFTQRKFGLVLTDLHMPEIDGYELAIKIRKREQQSRTQTPILAITAAASKEDAQRCLDVGMDSHLPKPIEFDRLKEVMDFWLPKEQETGSEQPAPKQETEATVDVTPDQPPYPVDPEALTRIVGDDPDVHQSLLGRFVETSEQTITEIHTAFEASSAKDIGELGHKLKSAARTIGANALADLSVELEAAGNAGEWQKIESLYPRLDPLFNDVRNYIISETKTDET